MNDICNLPGKTAITLAFNPIVRDPRVLKAVREIERTHAKSIVIGYDNANKNEVVSQDIFSNSDFYVIENAKRKYVSILASQKDRMRQYRLQQEFFAGAALRIATQSLTSRDKYITLFTHDMHTLYIGNLVTSALKAIFPLKSIVWVHDFHELVTGIEFKHEDTRKFFVTDELNYCLNPDLAITVSPHLANKLSLLYSLNPFVVYNSGMYEDQLNMPQDSELSCRSALSLKDDELLIVYSGSVTPQRNVHMPLSAVYQIKNLHYLIVTNKKPGCDEYLDSILCKAKSLGISNRVHVQDYVDPSRSWEVMIGATASLSMLPLYPNGDVALPNKLFDGIMARTPIITSNNPQLEEFVLKHDCGMVFTANDEQSLCNAIMTLQERKVDIDPKNYLEYCWDVCYRKVLGAIDDIHSSCMLAKLNDSQP